MVPSASRHLFHSRSPVLPPGNFCTTAGIARVATSASASTAGVSWRARSCSAPRLSPLSPLPSPLSFRPRFSRARAYVTLTCARDTAAVPKILELAVPQGTGVHCLPSPETSRHPPPALSSAAFRCPSSSPAMSATASPHSLDSARRAQHPLQLARACTGTPSRAAHARRPHSDRSLVFSSA